MSVSASLSVPVPLPLPAPVPYVFTISMLAGPRATSSAFVSSSLKFEVELSRITNIYYVEFSSEFAINSHSSRF